MDWQPIETAPRDRPIMLWVSIRQPAHVIGWWINYAGNADGGYWHPRIMLPTHWMPLPPAPQDAGGES